MHRGALGGGSLFWGDLGVRTVRGAASGEGRQRVLARPQGVPTGPFSAVSALRWV